MQLEVIKNIISRVLDSIISKISVNSFNNSTVILIFDSLIASTSLFISIQLRVGIDFFSSSYFLLFNNVFVFGLVSSSIFIWLKINNQSLDYINKLLLAILLSNTTFIPLMYFMNCNIDLPFAVLVINVFVMSVLLIGSRFIYYNLFRVKLYTLLIGNNDSITSLLNSYGNTIFNNLKDIGIINTDPNTMIDSRISIPVIGSIVDLQDIIKSITVNKIIITDDALLDDNRNILYILSQQYKFLLLQVYTSVNK